jgi:hypothetical protein
MSRVEDGFIWCCPREPTPRSAHRMPIARAHRTVLRFRAVRAAKSRFTNACLGGRVNRRPMTTGFEGESEHRLVHASEIQRQRGRRRQRRISVSKHSEKEAPTWRLVPYAEFLTASSFCPWLQVVTYSKSVKNREPSRWRLGDGMNYICRARSPAPSNFQLAQRCRESTATPLAHSANLPAAMQEADPKTPFSLTVVSPPNSFSFLTSLPM